MTDVELILLKEKCKIAKSFLEDAEMAFDVDYILKMFNITEDEYLKYNNKNKNKI